MIEQHASLQDGEVNFPKWVQVLSWIVGLCFPMAVLVGGWMASALIEVKLEIASVRAQLEVATEDRYRATQAEAAHQLLLGRIVTNEEDIEELQRLHGREQ